MSTKSSPCNLHPSISSSTSSSPSPEPSCFTLCASQKLTFNQEFKCSPRFKKRESFFCFCISIILRTVPYQKKSFIELLLTLFCISCQFLPDLSRWPLERQTLYKEIYFRNTFLKTLEQATPSCLESELVRTKNTSNCSVVDINTMGNEQLEC